MRSCWMISATTNCCVHSMPTTVACVPSGR
jgi:hypothetical protein